VGCAARGTLEGGVDIGTPGMAGGDRVVVVLGSILLGAHGTGWFVCFAQCCMVSVALAVVAV
jgi:hypothetical protein